MNGATSAYAPLKLYRVELRIKNGMKVRSLNEAGIDYDEAVEKSTTFLSKNIEARSIEEATRGMRALHIDRAQPNYTVEILAVHFIADIDHTEKEWHAVVDDRRTADKLASGENALLPRNTSPSLMGADTTRIPMGELGSKESLQPCVRNSTDMSADAVQEKKTP